MPNKDAIRKHREQLQAMVKDLQAISVALSSEQESEAPEADVPTFRAFLAEAKRQLELALDHTFSDTELAQYEAYREIPGG
jgi:hypothetical protein